MLDKYFTYFRKFIDWTINLTNKWFPKWYARKEAELFASIVAIKPYRMTVEIVMYTMSCSRWWAKQILKTATRRSDFVEHVDKDTGEHYWSLPDGYAEAFREEFVRTNGESFWTFKEKYKNESSNK